MPEVFAETASDTAAGSGTELALRIVLALVWGAAVAAVYLLSHGRGKPQSPAFATTLVLLSGLIAMVSMVIGGSVARAFSLVGALSIVRFRTVVEDTRDTAFVIFAVITGMAAGSGYLLLPAIAVPIIGGTAMLLSRGRWNRGPDPVRVAVAVRVGLGRDAAALVEPALKRVGSQWELASVETAKQGVSLEYVYTGRIAGRNNIAVAAAELGQTDGIQSVEIKQLQNVG